MICLFIVWDLGTGSTCEDSGEMCALIVVKHKVGPMSDPREGENPAGASSCANCSHRQVGK